MPVEILWDLEQGSDEWHEFRKDKISGTNAYDLINGMSIQDIIKSKSGGGNFSGSFATERGHLLENEARQLYRDLNNANVREAGAIINDKYPVAMYSPDGVIMDEKGLIEIKSFLHDHHEDLHENLDAHVYDQMQFGLFISEREYIDLVQYNPDEKDISKTFYIQRFYPDPEIFKKFEDALLNPYDDACIEETALTLIKLEQQLQEQTDQLKSQLEIRDALNNQITELKQRLKESTKGKISKKILLGKNTLSLNIHDTVKISVEDPSKVEDEYMSKQEVSGGFVSNGKIYQKIPNPKLVQNLVKAGKSLPKGFAQKTSRTISIKFNGKTI